MKTTNITLKIDAGLAHEAKALAARMGTSLSRLVADELMRMVSEEQGYASARNSAFAMLDKGLDLNVGTPLKRDELHDREKLR